MGTTERPYWDTDPGLKMNGWLWAAAIAGAWLVYFAFFQDVTHVVWGPNDVADYAYSCGAPFSPEYPLDGKGPCTDEIRAAYPYMVAYAAVGIVLAIVGYRKASDLRQTVQRGRVSANERWEQEQQ